MKSAAASFVQPDEERDLGAAWAFCHATLPAVSRTFALNIPILPARLRDAVCVAYLLCRTADTIEDVETLPAALRSALFAGLAEAMRGGEAPTVLTGDWAAEAAPADARLVAGLSQVLIAFRSLDAAQRGPIADCVLEMIAGMGRLSRCDESGVRTVSGDLAAVDEYCHVVAGTVGVMLTRLFAAEPPGLAGPADETRELGRRFGLGLQWVNILKDLPADARRGVCFVPPEFVEPATGGLRLSAARRGELISRAMGHLAAAERYILRVPAASEGVRLFCLWALMLAYGTLREVSRGAEPAKVSRDEVMEILERSRAAVADNAALATWWDEARRAALAAGGVVTCG